MSKNVGQFYCSMLQSIILLFVKPIGLLLIDDFLIKLLESIGILELFESITLGGGCIPF
jgi:hypothetical protein